MEKATSPQQAFRAAMERAAMEYLDRGWSIIPTSPTTKRAMAEWRHYQTRRPTRDEVRSWFRDGALTASGNRVFNFNLALITGSISGVVVVDCDNAEAVEYAQEHGLASPFSVKTTRGQHYYFAHPGAGQRFQNKVGGQGRDWPDVPGLDFRGDGGYVVLPPSVSFDDNGEVRHSYSWDECGLEWEQMRPWRGKPSMLDVTDIENFSFDQLDLSMVRAQTDYMSVWDQAAEWCRDRGRMMADGDGRNHWLTRFAGEKVKNGVVGAALEKLCSDFEKAFFADHMNEREFITTLRSVQESDRRNHPERYNEDGSPKTDTVKVAKEIIATAPKKIRPFYSKDIPMIRAALKETSFLLDPVIKARTITQIVGYNGHGKSLMTGAMLWALANGGDFGPFTSKRPAKVLYCDHEMDAGVIADRMEQWIATFGDAGENFAVMSRYMPDDTDCHIDGSMSLKTEEGFRLLGQWCHELQPEVVVIDTTRNAFEGMDEASPQEWAQVNRVAKTIRALGCAVILIHHRNKPGELGLGREAGSTAQLTDLDTQLFITQVFEGKQDAIAYAGLHDEITAVQDISGKTWTAFGYLTETQLPVLGAPGAFRLETVIEVRYGKRRHRSDNQATSYIGFAENTATGEKKVISTFSPKQKALRMAGAGVMVAKIAQVLMVPTRIINGWIDEGEAKKRAEFEAVEAAKAAAEGTE